MTPRQAEALRFIERFISEKGYSPSYEEIKDGCGWNSKQNVLRIVRALADYGKITYRPHRARSIEIVRQPDTERTRPTKETNQHGQEANQ